MQRVVQKRNTHTKKKNMVIMKKTFQRQTLHMRSVKIRSQTIWKKCTSQFDQPRKKMTTSPMERNEECNY